MNGSSLSTKLLVALAGQALFSLVLIVYVSQTQPPPPVWRATAHCRLLCSATRNHCAARDVTAFSCSIAQSASLHSGIGHRSVACLSSRRAISGAGAPHVARGEDVGWAGRLFIVGSAPVVLVSLTFAAIFYHHLAATRNTGNA